MCDLISVLIPVYNVQDYLSKCLDSVLQQTYSNIEIVIVDDGSTDKSGEICDEYQRKDTRIIVCHQENQGQSVARNKCIDLAKGEFFAFVDSDDIVTPTYVETLIDLAKKYNCKIACSNLLTFQEGEEPIVKKSIYKEECMPSIKAVEMMNYQEKLDTWPVCKLYHRSIFESGLRYPEGLIFEDFALTYLLFFESDKVVWCNKVDYYYLLRHDSTEGTEFSEKKLAGALNVINSMESNMALLRPIIKSYRCRMISFAYHLLLKMPKYHDKRYVFENIIKQYRISVLFDKKARKKARVAALLSYLGMPTVKLAFKLVDARKD